MCVTARGEKQECQQHWEDRIFHGRSVPQIFSRYSSRPADEWWKLTQFEQREASSSAIRAERSR